MLEARCRPYMSVMAGTLDTYNVHVHVLSCSWSHNQTDVSGRICNGLALFPLALQRCLLITPTTDHMPSLVLSAHAIGN